MGPRIIVSYDDSDNDRDALALGRLLAFSGAELSLAYVRHAQLEEEAREALEERQAEELLARGAASIGAPGMPRHVVVNAWTSAGSRPTSRCLPLRRPSPSRRRVCAPAPRSASTQSALSMRAMRPRAR